MSDVQPDIPGFNSYTRYDTKAGDSAASIAKRFGVPWKKIWEQSNNDDFRKALGRWLGKDKGANVVVIPDPNPAIIPPGLTLWIPTKHTDLVQLPAVGKPYTTELPFKRETLASRILTPAQTQSDYFELRIILPLYVEGVVPPADSSSVLLDDQYIEVDAWTPAELERFKQDVKKKAEAFWKNRFRLWAPGNYQYVHWPPGGSKTAGVNCTIEIQYFPINDGNCLTIHAYKRNLMKAQAAVKRYDRMDSGNWTNQILQDQTGIETPDDEGKKVTSNSNTAAHEIGHLLGMSHSGGNGDTPADYGLGGKRWMILNIMGSGDKVNSSNAVPWLRHIYWHTGVIPASWTVHTLDSSGMPLYL